MPTGQPVSAAAGIANRTHAIYLCLYPNLASKRGLIACVGTLPRLFALFSALFHALGLKIA